MVEEAGQVLESHIISALVESGLSVLYVYMILSLMIISISFPVEHLICIGDPEQLRPTLTNFGKYTSYMFTIE